MTSIGNSAFYGRYWSSTFGSGDYAWDLYFSLGYVDTGYYYRYRGRSVRPVTDSSYKPQFAKNMLIWYRNKYGSPKKKGGKI